MSQSLYRYPCELCLNLEVPEDVGTRINMTDFRKAMTECPWSATRCPSCKLLQDALTAIYGNEFDRMFASIRIESRSDASTHGPMSLLLESYPFRFQKAELQFYTSCGPYGLALYVLLETPLWLG